ncbi:hypothetical protein HJC99_02580 [Candidatus Saccharibacteria bacterium]|nr:hypothetical protein [Candidatus Saccharibacteria bacterium]
MNPQTTPVPQPSGERPATGTPELTVPNPEHLVTEAVTPEPGSPNAAPAGAPPITASDVAAAIAQMPSATPPAATSGAVPATASDVDVIEPEWVDQAESVIAKTAGDPHAEEEAVEALQVDYLAKRYGHNIAKSGDE